MVDNGSQSAEELPSDQDLVSNKALPQFLHGNRQISLAALREQIETQFIAETGMRPDLLLNADEVSCRDLLRDVVDYVLATESVTISRLERLAILDSIYRDLFSFGPLDKYLADPAVTEMTIDGPERVHIRYHAGNMITIDSIFDDHAHLQRIVQSVLSLAGAHLSESDPILEVGTVLAGRPARLSVIAPPISLLLHLEVRLHPMQTNTLESCIASELVDPAAAQLLKSILAAGHGLMVVGDVGTGKTTVLEALIPALPKSTIVVERSAEMRLPADFTRMAAVPPSPVQPPIDFATQIDAAMDMNPAGLVLDEVRFDEAPAMWRALTANQRPQLLWAFRGATDPLRLRTAFSMSVRRAVQGIDQEYINSALTDRLPFVALMARKSNQLRLVGISEWQPEGDSLTLKPMWPNAGIQPQHSL
jgi:pilus assembly protein CpaF